MTTKKRSDKPTVVKKYANRRLYDTGRSAYVTLDDLCEMIKEGHDFIVYDAKSGEDLTRSVLTQIIVEQEGRGQNLLPINFLRQLIGFYGDKMSPAVPNYLEQAFDMFTKSQDEFRTQINKTLGGVFPLHALEDINKRNVEMFQKAFRSFNPFAAMQNNFGKGGDKATAVSKHEQIEALKQNIADLQRELEKLNKN